MAHPFAACQSGQLTAARLRRTFTVLPFRAENKLSYNIALLPIFFKRGCCKTLAGSLTYGKLPIMFGPQTEITLAVNSTP